MERIVLSQSLQSLTTNPPSSSSGLILTLSQDLIFEFDLNGWVVVRNVLTAEEVAAANAAIDTHAAELHERRNPGLRNTKAGTVFTFSNVLLSTACSLQRHSYPASILASR